MIAGRLLQNFATSSLSFTENFQYSNNLWNDKFALVILPWTFNNQPLDKDTAALSKSIQNHCEHQIKLLMDDREFQEFLKQQFEQEIRDEARMMEIEEQLELVGSFSVEDWFKVKPHFQKLRNELRELENRVDYPPEQTFSLVDKDAVTAVLSKWSELADGQKFYFPQNKEEYLFLSL